MPPLHETRATIRCSLGNLCRWLAEQAEELGVEIFPGFPAAEILYNDDGSVKGVATGDMGVARDGSHSATTSPAWSSTPNTPSSPKARAAILTKRLKSKFELRKDSDPQVYGIGIKELWDVDPEQASSPGG